MTKQKNRETTDIETGISVVLINTIRYADDN